MTGVAKAADLTGVWTVAEPQGLVFTDVVPTTADEAYLYNPAAKMCPGNTIEKKIVREAFADMLPEHQRKLMLQRALMNSGTSVLILIAFSLMKRIFSLMMAVLLGLTMLLRQTILGA